MKLSVLIPARDEAASLPTTIEYVTCALDEANIDHEILVVEDFSSDDDTQSVVQELARQNDRVRYVRSHHPPGYGYTVRTGLERFRGDAVVVFMADASDDPRDLVLYYRVLEAGFDCALGSRFMPGGRVEGYPRFKLGINRLVNWAIRALFRHGYNDTTNAFKAYRRSVIDTMQPLLSNHFNLTVEMPLKAITRGHSYAVVPISWRHRDVGESKLRLKEMGSRYLFIVLYVFLEYHLSHGDYRRPKDPQDARPSLRAVEGGFRRRSRRAG